MFGWKRKPAREPIRPITQGYQPGRLRPIGSGPKPLVDSSEGRCDLPPPPSGGSSVMKPPSK